MNDKTTHFFDMIKEKCHKTRKFKPCIRVPIALKSTLVGKLNIMIKTIRIEDNSPFREINNFDLGDIDKFSSIKDTSEKSCNGLGRSRDSIEVSEVDNPSVSSFNIVKKCQMLNGIIQDSEVPRPQSLNTPYLQHRQSTDILVEFDFLHDLQIEEPRRRLNKRDIEWGCDIHDIYDPEFTSGSDGNTDQDIYQPVSLNDLELKSKNSAQRERLNTGTADKVQQHKTFALKKNVAKIEQNIMKRVNTPLSLGVMKVHALDFKKKGKPRALSIKPVQSKNTMKMMPQFKSKVLGSNNMGSKYINTRPSIFDVKEPPELKKRKVTNMPGNSSPNKLLGVQDEHVKAFNPEKNTIGVIKRKLGSINYRNNVSMTSNNARNNSGSIHF